MEPENKIDNWTAPRGSENCPSPAKFAEWMKNPTSEEAQAHLAECAACAAALNSVHEAANESATRLEAFMREVRQRAQEESEHRSSPWKIFVNYFSASRAQTVGAVAAVATVVLIATSGLWHQAGVQQSQPVQTIVMDRDVNGEALRQAFAEFRDASAAISGGGVSKSEAAAQINQLNQTLATLDKSKLQPEQKQELETLQGQYQALVFDRLQPSLSSSLGGTKAQNLQTDFFNSYASYLAKDGEPLTVSPEVSMKFSKTRTYVIGRRDAPDAKREAASQAVQELQTRVPEMTLEYKVAPMAAAAAQSSAASHPD